MKRCFIYFEGKEFFSTYNFYSVNIDCGIIIFRDKDNNIQGLFSALTYSIKVY